MEAENVFKIAATDSKVREFLTSKGWEFQGEDEEMEMDAYRNKKTGKQVCIEDISENFPVTFLIGELSLAEFAGIARNLTPEIKLLEVDSSWEGRPTTIVVAMTGEQVKNMFGRRTKMRQLSVGKSAISKASYVTIGTKTRVSTREDKRLQRPAPKSTQSLGQSADQDGPLSAQ